MEIINRTEKRIYDLIIEDIYKSDQKWSLLTNVNIGKVLDLSPNTVRDKVIKLRKQGHLNIVINYFDDDNKFFQRVIRKGNTPG